jgi:hypothetical protein
MKTEVAREPATQARRTWRGDLPVAGAAAGAATLIWVLARVLGVDLDVHSGGGVQGVGLPSVVIAPVVATLAAGALLRGWERRSMRARRRWTAVSLAVLAVSLLGPVSAVTARAGVVLAAMHLVVGSVIVAGLTRRDR